MAGHFARLDGSHIVANVLHCRDLSWWRQQQQNGEVNRNKWVACTQHASLVGDGEQDFELSYGRHPWRK